MHRGRMHLSCPSKRASEPLRPLLQAAFLPSTKSGKLALRSFVFSAELPRGHPRGGNPTVCVPGPDMTGFGKLKKDSLPQPQKRPCHNPRVAALEVHSHAADAPPECYALRNALREGAPTCPLGGHPHLLSSLPLPETCGYTYLSCLSCPTEWSASLPPPSPPQCLGFRIQMFLWMFNICSGNLKKSKAETTKVTSWCQR